MADKDKLASMLGGDAQKPPIRRGQGVRLSTEAPPAAEGQKRTNAASQNSEIAETQKRTNAASQNSEIAASQERTNAETQQKPKRVNRGYMLREDLIRNMRVLAVQEGRNLYEVMEEALEAYLDQHRQA